jgi:hypothetical protein
MNEDLIIFGLGAVGSHLCYLLTKLPENHCFNPKNCNITIIDHDTVEQKNLLRQFYTRYDVGKTKTLGTNFMFDCYSISDNVRSFDVKIESENDLVRFNRNALVIIATDNIKSKKIIANFFKNRKIIVNCDQDYYELKDHLDKEELTAWQLGEGYNTTQNFLSNMMSALEIYYILYNDIFPFGIIKRGVDSMFKEKETLG